MCEGVLPVTYTTGEFLARRKALAHDGPSVPESAKEEVLSRLDGLAEVLNVNATTLACFVAEAQNVAMNPEPPCGGRPLPSPMSRRDCYVLYTVVRALRPRFAVETGVANGRSSAMILAAMERGGEGSLVGIDCLDEERDRLGQFITYALRPRFTLRLADSIEELTKMLGSGQTLDLFLHDSNHAYRHARREYELAWQILVPGGVLCSHDILYNNAFDRFIRAHEHEMSGWAKLVNFGVARKETPGSRG